MAITTPTASKDRTASASQSLTRSTIRFLQWCRLGWYDLVFSYRPSIVGPIWQTLSTALWVGGLAIVFGPMQTNGSNYVPYLIIGVVLWNFISTCITSGARVFISNSGIMLNMPTPNLLHVTRLWANLVFKFSFQFITFLPLPFIFNLDIGLRWFEAIIAFFIISVLGYTIIIISGLISTRYRDAEHLFLTAVRFLFFLTPIFWIPTNDGSLRGLITVYNPFFYIIEIVRRPLLGEETFYLSWFVTLGILSILIITAYSGLRLYGRKVAGWL